MDILNWLYLAKNKFVRTTLGSTKDLMIFGSKVGFNKRGDLYQNYAMSAEDFLAINRPYKVYTAQLTQGGGSNQTGINWDDPNPILTIGVTYTIQDNGGGLDMTNVGAPNNNINTSFVATGTTPNSWGEGVVIYNTGAPVANVVENTTGLNLYYMYAGTGQYNLYIGEDIQLVDKSVIVFVNGGNYVTDPKILVKANYSYEENIFIISTFNDGIPENSILSDSDRFYGTSIEIRVYN